MQYNNDSFARFVGAAVKLAAPDAVIDTVDGDGIVTLASGQVFGFNVEELEPAEAAARAAGEPGA